MSVNLTQAMITEFDNEVKHAYQGMGKLRNTVTVRNGVVGGMYRFQSMGSGSATMRGTSSSDVNPMNIGYQVQPVTLTDWIAPEYTDIFDQAEVNFDEKSELAMTIAKAISRREDQLIIDAFAEGGFAASGVVPPAIGQPNDTQAWDFMQTGNFSMGHLREARRIMQRQEIMPMNQHIALTAEAMQHLLEDTEVTSSDFNTVKALVSGDLDSYMGFKFHIIGDRNAENGLPDNTAYAYAMDAIGLAIGIDMKTTIDYVPQKLSWLCVGMLKAGAVRRDRYGIVRLRYT